MQPPYYWPGTYDSEAVFVEGETDYYCERNDRDGLNYGIVAKDWDGMRVKVFTTQHEFWGLDQLPDNGIDPFSGEWP